MQVNQAQTLHGGCHCGAVQVEFTTGQALSGVSPRACDCSFCCKHGAAYISDPAGHLRITVAKPDALHAYRQGARLARFQLCARCGVLVAVVFVHQGVVYGAVNAGCLDARQRLGAAVPASPQRLRAQEKVSRWLQVWVPGMEFVGCGMQT